MTTVPRHPDHPIPLGNAQPEHLGDGAYVSHDGYGIWVSCDREDGLHAVCLEQTAVEELATYLKKVRGFHG